MGEATSNIFNIETKQWISSTLFNPLFIGGDFIESPLPTKIQDSVPHFTNGKVYQSLLSETHTGETTLLEIDCLVDTITKIPFLDNSINKLISSKESAYWILPGGEVQKLPEFTVLTYLTQNKAAYICSVMDDENEGVVFLSDSGAVVTDQGTATITYLASGVYYHGTVTGCELLGDIILVKTSTETDIIHE